MPSQLLIETWPRAARLSVFGIVARFVNRFGRCFERIVARRTAPTPDQDEISGRLKPKRFPAKDHSARKADCGGRY